MFVLTLFVFITLAMWGSAMCFYFQNYVDQGSLYEFIRSLGLVRAEGEELGLFASILDSFGLIAYTPDKAYSIGLSLFNMIGALIQLVGVITLSEFLANRFGKRSTFMVCLTLTALFTASFILPAPTSIGLIFVLGMLKSLAYAPTVPLLWAMIADVADHMEYRTHRRATGLCFSGVVFALKAGLGVGGAIAGIILSMFGYINESGAAQTESSLLGIRLASSAVPAICFMIGVVALSFYPITKQFNEKMQKELAERRSLEKN
jgi:Na+/melibiose symporter-like transporter